MIADYEVHKLHVLARLKHKVNHAISNNQPLFCIGFQLADLTLSNLNISKRFTNLCISLAHSSLGMHIAQQQQQQLQSNNTLRVEAGGGNSTAPLTVYVRRI